MPQVFADMVLARRLELAEARANAAFVEARAALQPDVGAAWIVESGAYAMFDGPESPCTQTFGLGMMEPLTAEALDRIEAFFERHGAPLFHEVCPLADLSAPQLLASRGYEPFEFTSILFLPLSDLPPQSATSNPNIRARIIRPDERERWAALCVQGWSEYEEYASTILELARLSTAREDSVSFIAELEGKPVATASLNVVDGVVLLAGASTIPEARNRGAQNSLLHARLRYGIDKGCELAMMGALAGSGSQRNAERQGFRIAYTRAKWRKRA